MIDRRVEGDSHLLISFLYAQNQTAPVKTRNRQLVMLISVRKRREARMRRGQRED